MTDRRGARPSSHTDLSQDRMVFAMASRPLALASDPWFEPGCEIWLCAAPTSHSVVAF